MGPVPAMDCNINKTECYHFSRLLSLLNSYKNDINCNSIITVADVTVTAATAVTAATLGTVGTAATAAIVSTATKQ